MARLISIIIVLAVFLAFIVLNMGDKNRCDIFVGFHTFENIPVFITILSSFLLGTIFALPFGFSLSRKLKKNAREDAPVPEKKKRWGKDKNKGTSDNGAPAEVEEINKDSSPYGID